jgi:hypothetical protein
MENCTPTVVPAETRKLSLVVAALPKLEGETRAKTEVCSSTRRIGLKGVYSRVTV